MRILEMFMSHHDDRHWFNLAKTVGFCCILSLIGACASTPAHAASKKVKTDQGVITMSNRVIDFIGPVHFRMIKRAQKQFMMFNAQSNEPIWIRINSPGGSVGAGLVLIDTFRASKSPVYCLVESRAYSMAAITLVFCDKRYALNHATIMLHEASYGTMGDDMSNRSRMKFTVKYLDGLHREIAQRLKMDHATYRKKIRNSWWLLAKGAAKAGIIDAVVTRIKYKQLGLERIERKRTVVQRTKKKVLRGPAAGAPIPKRRD